MVVGFRERELTEGERAVAATGGERKRCFAERGERVANAGNEGDEK